MADLTKEWETATPVSEEEWERATPVKGKTMRESVPVEGTITAAPPSWVPWVKPAVEMLGFGAGSFLGGPIGAGLGYATARQVNKLLPGGPPPRPLIKEDVEKELGVPLSEAEYQDFLQGGPQWKGLRTKLGMTPATPTEQVIQKAGEFGTDVGTGMALEAGGRYAGEALLPKVLPFYARGRTPAAMEVSEIAAREGVEIPAADITGSTTQSAITSSVQKLPQSAYTMQKEAVKATEQFSEYAERTLGKIGGRVEPYLGGQAAQEGKLIKMAQNVAQGGQFYDAAATAAKDTPISFDKVATAIEKVQSSDRYKLLSEAGKKEIDNFIKVIKSRTIPAEGEIAVPTGGGATVPMQVSQAGGKGFVDQAALEGAAKEANTITDYLGAEGFRKSLAEKVYKRGASKMEGYGPMRDIYKAFEADMEASAKAAGSEAHTAFKQARDFWSKNVFNEELEKGIVGRIPKVTSPEKAVTLLKNASMDDISRVKNSLPPQNFLEFRQGLFTHLLEKNAQTSTITNETIYNGPQLYKDLFGRTGIGEARLKALLSPEEFKFLKELATVGRHMGSSWRIAGNPSGTAHTLYILHLLGQVGSAAGAAAAGEYGRREGGYGTGLAAAGAFLSPYILAKLITSKVGRQYLTAGFPKLERAFGRVLPFAVIGGRGIINREAPMDRPPQKEESEGYDKELSQSRQAISAGAPADKVKAMYKARTGKEYPE